MHSETVWGGGGKPEPCTADQYTGVLGPALQERHRMDRAMIPKNHHGLRIFRISQQSAVKGSVEDGGQ